MSTLEPRGIPAWTAPAHVEAKVRRKWATGELLRRHAEGLPFEAIEVPLRGPSSADLAERLDDARSWAAAIERAADSGRRFGIVPTTIGGRHLGRTTLPGRAVVETFDQAWRMLGVGGAMGAVAQFDEVLRQSAKVPAACAWALAHPLRAIEIAAEWPALLAARDWLDWSRDSGRYLREIDAPGVDTKLVERHRGVLAEMLAVPASASAFAAALGLAIKPGFVRMRFDPELFGMPTALTEASFRLDELTALRVPVERALIVENEISYLSVPVPQRGVVLWGKGYDASQPASLSWLERAAESGGVRYWGDIDTHGFAILNRVRRYLPSARSVMMDRETLLAHEERWGSEKAPTDAALPHLTEPEAALYADLVTDRYTRAVRLEQERIDWSWVERHLD